MSRGWYEGGNASSPHNGSLFFAVTGARGGEEEFLREGGWEEEHASLLLLFLFPFFIFPQRGSLPLNFPFFVHSGSSFECLPDRLRGLDWRKYRNLNFIY